MPEIAEKIAQCDPVWADVRADALRTSDAEPVLASFLHATVLKHDTLESVLGFHLAQKLGNMEMSAMALRQVFDEAFGAIDDFGRSLRADLVAALDRDPACDHYISCLLYYKGFHALQVYRAAHYFWNNGREHTALFLQNRASAVFGVDIHPAAKIGIGIFMDHATGIVIGETAVVEDDVSMLHGVTLGGTGKETGDRHPKIRRGVLLGAGAKVLGNIEIGECCRVASGSVVLKSVPRNMTVAGVPAKIVGEAGCEEPSRRMDQIIGERDESE